MIRLPAAVDPVNATLSVPGWVTRCSPDLAAAGDDVDHARRHARLVEGLGEHEVAERASGGGLTTTVQPAARAGADLPGGQGDRGVPGHDGGDHPDRLLGHQAGAVGR